MKKILLMAAAAAALFSACTKENDNNPENGMLNVMLKLQNVETPTKFIGAPGSAIKATLSNGHVYVINSDGSIHGSSVALNVAAAGSSGQSIQNVPASAKIFVLGNIPADVTVTTPTNLTNLLATASAISAQLDYAVPALGNIGGAPVAITTTSATEGVANVQICPLYSRIELAKVTGTQNADGDKVKAFNVTGVWVDSWNPQFTLAGLNAGTRYEQLTNTDFSGNAMGDITGPWAATGSEGNMVAVPDAGKSWVYHVPAGGLPRLIVRLEGVKYTLAEDGSEVVSSETHFITVKSYTHVVEGSTVALTAFEAGKIYRIGGTAGIVFQGDDNLYPIPNPTNIDLTLTVEVEDWQVEDLGVELY